MASKPAQTGGVIAIRSSQLFITSPGLSGFHALIDPEDPFGDGLKFKINHHQNEAETERLMGLMDEHVIEANWDDMMKALDKAEKKPPGGGWVKPNGRDWVQDHQKQPKPEARQQLPFIGYSNAADFKNKDGQIVRKTMRAYDSKGKLLDLEGLHMGYGSVIQVVLMPGLFISGLIKQPQPSLKLQGIRVLKLEQFGSTGAALGEVDEDDMKMLGEDVQADDLSAYMDAGKDKAPTRASKGPALPDLDDDLPF